MENKEINRKPVDIWIPEPVHFRKYCWYSQRSELQEPLY